MKINIPSGSDFSLQNIPFGIFSPKGEQARPGTRIGDTVIDLSAMADFGFFDDLVIGDMSPFYQPVLNDLISLGKPVTRSVRQRILEVFSENTPDSAEEDDFRQAAFHPASDVIMHLPVFIPDYTDFYSSQEHATNVGIMFRDPANALLPNWKHIPVGYHGRASSIVVSGAALHRPMGQTKNDDQALPSFGPSRQLDFELEMGFVVARDTELGTSIATSDAEDYIFGLLLFNDLSARDIQKWEYVPLGPFLSKNFGSVVSPWIVTLEALEPFRAEGPVQDPKVLPYLEFEGARNFDIRLEVAIRTSSGDEMTVCRSNFRHMYWNMSQQLAHHTVNGCNIRVGDLYASGTISGPDEGSYGSMLELAWKGTRPIPMPDGTTRTFIQDHDTVIIRGWAEKEGLRVGFGEAVVTILPVNESLANRYLK